MVEFKTSLNVKQSTFKNYIDSFSDVDYDNIIKELTEKSIKGLMNQILEEYPDTPVDVVQAFVKTFFLFELTTEYDIESRSYNVIITPVWKDSNMVNWESEEWKLLCEYSGTQLSNI